MKYTCKLSIKVEKDLVEDLVNKIIDQLSFTPDKMDLFFNEFEQPRESLSYKKSYLLENLSIKQEMEGITSFSLYSKNHLSENVKPFFRFKITHLKNSNQLRCSLEWVAYDKIDQGLLLEKNESMKNILSMSSLIYCYYYDQEDVWEQTNQERDNDSWGRRLTVKGFDFMAAPLMYFGKECDSAIPFNLLSAFSKSKRLQIKGEEVLKVSLFDINEQADKKENREAQRMFWESLELKKLAEDYKSKNKIDFTAFLKSRAAQSKRKK